MAKRILLTLVALSILTPTLLLAAADSEKGKMIIYIIIKKGSNALTYMRLDKTPEEWKRIKNDKHFKKNLMNKIESDQFKGDGYSIGIIRRGQCGFLYKREKKGTTRYLLAIHSSRSKARKEFESYQKSMPEYHYYNIECAN